MATFMLVKVTGLFLLNVVAETFAGVALIAWGIVLIGMIRSVWRVCRGGPGA